MLFIGPVIMLTFVAGVVAAMYLLWQRSHLDRPRRPGLTGQPIPRDAERWLDAGLITEEQVRAITAFEQREVSPRKIPLFTEALGYIGAILAVAGGGTAIAQVWDEVTDLGHVAILAAATILTLAGGFLLRDQEEPAMKRLMSVLWALSVGAAAATFAVSFVDLVELDEDAVPLAAAGVTSIYAGVLWAFRRRVLQAAALFVAGLVAVEGLVQFAGGGEAAAWIAALVAWAYGLVWFALGWYGRVPPAWATVPLGAIVAMWAPGVGAGEYGWLYAVGIVSAAGLMTLSITSRKLPLLGIGGVAAFIYLTSSVVRYFGDTLGVPLALAIVGSVVLVIAVVLGRTRTFGGWHGPAGHAA